jgi:hypothetical protein
LLSSLPKVIHKALLRSRGFVNNFLQTGGTRGAVAYIEWVVVLETLTHPAPPHSLLTG